MYHHLDISTYIIIEDDNSLIKQYDSFFEAIVVQYQTDLAISYKNRTVIWVKAFC